ncbi:hypothetical protein I7I50_02859 [Histoplasma capsulatum G186AR]|uniref:Uncharacterized protein n=1 Tax=Ajellomyces capsulatus TaxID=5037 RepID=A0A8H7Z240_AJECA|nr:hypothetical protein I7I52_00474 [Histoplasma capsulatum]QSS71860.1 hypothetical protein I7I50_02859 [Histoplasma capsulatum G186AR]
MNSELDVLNTGAIHRNRPGGEGLVRSRSETRYVRGWLKRKRSRKAPVRDLNSLKLISWVDTKSLTKSWSTFP